MIGVKVIDVSSSHLPSSSAHAFGDTLASIIDDGMEEIGGDEAAVAVHRERVQLVASCSSVIDVLDHLSYNARGPPAGMDAKAGACAQGTVSLCPMMCDISACQRGSMP